MAKSPIKQLLENKVKELLLKNREKFGILNILNNQNKLIVIFDPKLDQDLNQIQSEISQFLLIQLSKIVGKGKELSNLPLISYIVNQEANNIAIEV